MFKPYEQQVDELATKHNLTRGQAEDLLTSMLKFEELKVRSILAKAK